MRSKIDVVALLSAGVLAAGLMVGCGKKETSSTTENTSATPPAESTGTAAGGLTDANIAAIVVAANDADVSNGNAAKGKTKNAEVRQFAEMMVADHSSSNKQAKDLAGQLNLSPQDNETSEGIKKGQDAVRDSLKSLKGGAFDKAYIDNEVSYHETVLNALDNTLIPGAQNDQLKKLLQDTRPVVAHHLDEAKKLQEKLSRGAAAPATKSHKG